MDLVLSDKQRCRVEKKGFSLKTLGAFYYLPLLILFTGLLLF